MSQTQDFISLPQRTQSISQSQLIDISWKNLNVTVQDQSKRQISDMDQPLISNQGKYILNNLQGYAKSGEMTAVMGPSGAGKTTLLACLSKRFKASKTSIMQGEILANNVSYSDYNDFGGFVMQDDILMGSLTVKETLMFVANLRVKGTQFDKYAKVDQVIKDLNLRNCQNTYIGDRMIKGVSGGEKKRTCIGVELIADPPVLILDEPTSGLDSFTAFVCLNILKRIAKQQLRTIIFTIHQPSTDIYQLFDRLIMLNNGETVYQGQANQLVTYCEQVGLKIDRFSNPLDVVMNNMNTYLNGKDVLVTHQNYVYYMEEDCKKFRSSNQGYIKLSNHSTFSQQLKYLLKRTLLNYIRSPNLLKSKVMGAIFMSLFLGWLYWQVGNTSPAHSPTAVNINEVQVYLQNMTGAMFVCGTSAIFSALGPLLMLFPMERTVFLKEENSKLYTITPYFLSKVVLEVPINIFIQICLSTALYFAFGLVWTFWSVFEFYLINIMVSLCGNGIGIFTGCLFEDAKRSASLGPIVLLPLQLFGGQTVNLNSIPKWISWIQYISPFKYFLEGFGRSQLEDVRFNIYGVMEIDPMEFLGRTFGLWNCIFVLIGIAVGFHIMAAVFLKLLVRKLNV